MEGLSLIPAGVADTDVLFRLMQLYYFESSSWSGEEIGGDGLYDGDRADVAAALLERPHWARLLWLDGVLCGFVLVDDIQFQGQPLPELADLFVLPKHRGKGIAKAVVTTLVAPGSGQWLLAIFRKDRKAWAFWTRNLPRMGMDVETPVNDEDEDFDLFLIRARACE